MSLTRPDISGCPKGAPMGASGVVCPDDERQIDSACFTQSLFGHFSYLCHGVFHDCRFLSGHFRSPPGPTSPLIFGGPLPPCNSSFREKTTSSRSPTSMSWQLGVSFFLFGLINNGERWHHAIWLMPRVFFLNAYLDCCPQFSMPSFCPPRSTSSPLRHPRASSRFAISHRRS